MDEEFLWCCPVMTPESTTHLRLNNISAALYLLLLVNLRLYNAFGMGEEESSEEQPFNLTIEDRGDTFSISFNPRITCDRGSFV